MEINILDQKMEKSLKWRATPKNIFKKIIAVQDKSVIISVPSVAMQLSMNVKNNWPSHWTSDGTSLW